MAKFAGKNRIPVQVEGDQNIIWIVDKLNYGMRQRILSAMAHISAGVGQQLGQSTARLSFDVGAYNIAVLQNAIVGWEGPDFNDVELTPEAILELDTDDPLVAKAVEEASIRGQRSMENSSPNSEKPSKPDGEDDSAAKS